MNDILIFLISFYFCLFSTLGYGNLFYKICYSKNVIKKSDLIYIGFFGLAFLTIISMISSIFVAHNFYHNLGIHFFGLTFFLFSKFESKKNFIKNIFYISFFLMTLLVISKTNDDLSYYHLPFTKYLTENKIIFGMGHLNHGYNLLSSLFFLNSLFYLPFIDLYSFHFSMLFFLIFFNFFLIYEIFSNKKGIITYLYFFAFLFFNISFNRIAEYGTDKAGQLLIVLVILKLFQIICIDIKKKDNQESKILFLLPLVAYCISLKTYFLPYIILSLIIFIINSDLKKSFKIIFYSKSFLFSFLILILIFTHHFISTGCFISPLSFTCLNESIIWNRNIDDIKNLSIWLEQWAKAGAGPNFRVENVQIYIANFNWISNWIDMYFVGKFTDQILILFSSYFLIFIFFKKFKYNNKNKIINKKILYFYSLLLIIFIIWFFNHPTLRYGGYAIVFLIISIPISIFFEKFIEKDFFKRNFKYFIVFVILVLNLKNINRIVDEFDRSDKNVNFPFYFIKNKKFISYEFENGLNLYSAHHCWATPTPCGQISENVIVLKRNGYFFIQSNK